MKHMTLAMIFLEVDKVVDGIEFDGSLYFTIYNAIHST